MIVAGLHAEGYVTLVVGMGSLFFQILGLLLVWPCMLLLYLLPSVGV